MMNPVIVSAGEAIPIRQVEIGCMAQEEIASSLTLLAMTYLMITLKRY